MLLEYLVILSNKVLLNLTKRFTSKNWKMNYLIQLIAHITTVVFRSQSSHFSLALFRDGYGNDTIKMKHTTVMFVISYIHLYYLLLHLQQCCHSSTAESLTRSTNISILNNIIRKMEKKIRKIK
jgi:hypothetical protein